MAQKREKFYTEKNIEDEFGIPAELIRRHFKKPRLRTVKRGGKTELLLTWNQALVERGLSNPGLIRDMEKLIREREYAESRREIRNFLLGFDIENLRQQALSLNRHFILHIGPTNSGKTYESIEALKYAETGLYLGPLRLLALEMFDKLNWENCPTNLITGEESIEIFEAGHTASTIELCDYSHHYDVAVIDEAQMITDAFRGDRWLKAIYCVDASEVHVCLAPEAELLICEILDGFDADYEIVRHERLAPLSFTGIFRTLKDTRPGDALIVFSRKAVLAVAAELSHMGINASVIYGALPPASRREEVRKFAAGETTVVVATDAIGMGISLPIKRVVFCETRKFDGTGNRSLNKAEVKQIAGRAGRYGIYNKGEVLTMDNPELIKDALSSPAEQSRHITIPFPGEAVDSEYPLDELMTEWNNLPAGEGFERANMSDSVYLYKRLAPIARQTDRTLIYGLITCPVDIKDERLVDYWRRCAYAIIKDRSLPEPDAGKDSLEECELRYRQLDVRHQLLRRQGIEEDRMGEKLALCRIINSFLERDKDVYLKHCKRCGKVLPATSAFGICDRCFRKQSGWR